MSKKPLVLYVENQIYPTYLELLKTDFDLVVAESAKKADKRLKEKSFDGVILDIMMDAEDENLIPTYLNVPAYFTGLTILDKIKKGDYADFGNDSDLPVVVFSGVALVEGIRKIRTLVGQYNEDQYFKKPADIDDVTKVLKKLISIRSSKK